MLRLGMYIVIFGLCAGGIYYSWNHNPTFRHAFGNLVDNGDFLTLEARYTAEEIMEQQSGYLIKSSEYSYREPTLKFYPYLLLDVRYSRPDKTTAEGVMLWSMVNGEMVLNTDSWEITHGYEDCLLAGASRNEYRVIQHLSKRGHGLGRDELIQLLEAESTEVDRWLASLVRMQLVIKEGGRYRVHFERPKLAVKPQTTFTQQLVTKTFKHAKKVSSNYSTGTIESNAIAAFGPSLVIRNSRSVYMPVYSIEVQNPDGSVLTQNWNALNGKRLHSNLSSWE